MRGPAGETRRGRRERERERERTRSRTTYRRRPFLERNRGAVLALAAIAAVVLAGGFVVIQANSKAYACSTQTNPAPAASAQADGSPVPVGQVQPDLGRNHILAPANQRYAACPPASGPHYPPPDGPIPARYYSPDDSTLPQGWIHNLEHGGLVILYSCDNGACDATTQQALQDLFASFPESPVCKLAKGTIGPVITRFEEMKAPIAALLWGRVLLQDKLDTAQVLEYFRTQAELHNPEPQCARPSPAPSPGPSGSPGASPGASSSAAPSSDTSPSTSPATSAGPSPSPS
ncbi:MAG: DUF3105 domain-containing protein [Chloroflexota bacterium]|nr:DUF3105 domain-containing protein [Chloroflexota bacterium]